MKVHSVERLPRLTDQGAFRSSYVAWGYFNIFLTAIWSFVPYGVEDLPLGLNIDFGYLIAFASSLLYIVVGVTSLRLPLRLGWCVCVCLLIQVSLAFSTLYMGISLGRMAALGSQAIWPVMLIVSFLAFSMQVYVWPRSRVIIENVIVALFSISAMFGILQFLKFAPAYKVIVNPVNVAGSDYENGGIRAVGLAYFPATAAVQGFVGAAILVGRLRVRAWKIWEVAAFLLLFAFFVVAQFRTLYLMSIPLGVVAFLLYRRHNRVIPFVALTLVFALAVGAVLAFPKRFEYVLSPAKYRESMQVRSGRSYSQVAPIFEHFPMTGLGSDTALALGFTDPTIGKDKWSDYVIDSSMFLALATSGVPGLTLLIVFEVTLFGWLIREAYRARYEFERSARLIAALLCTSMFAIDICLNNGLIYPQVRWVIIAVIALAVPTFEEAGSSPRELYSARTTPRLLRQS